jgi:hypothetical protein
VKTTNWTYLTVASIVRVYMLGALAISFGHIVTASHMLGLTGWQAWTVPFAIDGFALLGMIGRSARFSADTQRTGFRLQIAAGAVSLVANVYAGHTPGERLYGALIVAAFIVAEWYAAKLRPAPVVIPTQAQRRSASAKKAAATRKANAATKPAPATKAAARRPRAVPATA